MISLAMVWFLVVNTRVTKLALHVGQVLCPYGPRSWGRLFLKEADCRNPTLAKCGGEAQHFQSWGFGLLRDSRMFRARQQGSKHLALRCSWCHWKGLEA
jgi:hypothetical protein